MYNEIASESVLEIAGANLLNPLNIHRAWIMQMSLQGYKVVTFVKHKVSVISMMC